MFALRPPRPLRSTTVLLGTMRFTNICIVAAALTLAACATQPPVTYDLVIANGRVMDPESGLDAVRHVGIRGGKIEAVSATPLAGTRVIDATEPRRRARLHRPARARPAGGVVPDDGARRRHLGVRARGRHRRRRGVVPGARGRADRQLRRVDRPHPGAHEGARRSRHGPAAGRHRRQRHGDRRADGGDGGDPARGARARRGGDGLRQRLHARRADVGDRAHVPRRRRGRRVGAHPHARRRWPGCARRSPRRSPPARRCTSCT